MSFSLSLQTLLSTAAVMATVLVILFVITGIGLLTSFSWQQGVAVRIRSAIWLGWFWVAVYVSTAHLFFAMKPPVAVPLIITGLIGWFLLVRKSSFPKLKLRGQPWWVYGTGAALFALFALLSNQTLRDPIYHSDAGWYRIPYVLWTEISPTVPGLAHLHSNFGFGHVTDLISGVLGGAIMLGEGYKFMTLIFLGGAMLEIIFRVSMVGTITRSSSQSVATCFLIFSFAAIFLVSPFASIWISSPTPDLLVALLVVVGCTYLIQTSHQNVDMSLVGVACFALASSLRLLNIPFLCAGLFLLLMRKRSTKQRDKPESANSGYQIASLLTGVLVLATTGLVSTFIRTGYPLFPYSDLRFGAPSWSLSSDTLYETKSLIADWGLAWTTANPSQIDTITTQSVAAAVIREPAIQLLMWGLICALIASILWLRSPNRPVANPGPVPYILLAAIATSAIGVINAPDPRFIYGPLIVLAFVPASFLMTYWQSPIQRLSRGTGVLVVTTVFLLLVFLQKGYLGSALLNPVMADGSGPFGAHSPPKAVTETFLTNSGLEIKYAPDWLCWATEPPCTFAPNPELELRGETLRGGFRISR